MPVKKGYKGDYKKVMTELRKNFKIVQRKRDWNKMFSRLWVYNYIPWNDSAIVRASLKKRIINYILAEELSSPAKKYKNRAKNSSQS